MLPKKESALGYPKMLLSILKEVPNEPLGPGCLASLARIGLVIVLVPCLARLKD